MTTITTTKREAALIDLLGDLFKKTGATAGELGVSIGDLKILAGRGLVEFVAAMPNGIGRPAHAYKLTPEGRKVARKLAKKHA